MNLAYCEIYKPYAHGILDNSHNIKYVYTSLLYQFGISLTEFFDTTNPTRSEWEENGPWVNYYNNHDNIIYTNPYVRNTGAIKLNRLQIVQKIEYQDYTFCIIKTIWLKIFQRKWKRYYELLMNKRKNLKNILKRSQLGKWDN
jgi:hypothetical protein